MDSITLIAAASFGIVALVTLAIGIALLRLAPEVRSDRLSMTTAPVATAGPTSILRWDGRQATGLRGFVERLGTTLTSGRAAAFGRYTQRLRRAGYYDPRALSILFGAKICLGVAGLLVYTLYGIVGHKAITNIFSVSALLGVFGFVLPDLVLHMRTRRREVEMTNTLPDVLDLMMVCVEAGLGFDAAVTRITEQWPGAKAKAPLIDELDRMQLELRAGRPREEALRAFAERVGTVEIKSIVTAFIQCDRLGTSLGKALRVQAEASRVRRRHRAETRAQLAPLKMLFPTILFLLPAFMMVAMAPALLRMVQLMSSGS